MLARTLNLLYGAAGDLYFVSRGRVVESFKYTGGVLQGCPLGLHGLCLALWDFFAELNAALCNHNASAVWIADDLTIVLPRQHAATAIDWIAQHLPRYGMRTSTGKLYAYLPGPPHEYYSDMLRGRGFRVSDQGLQRLLGAPIGTRSFLCKSAADGGHLASLTDAATSFVRRILQVKHVQAQYHLLRWSACSLLLHLGKLVTPHIFSAYAMQFSDSIDTAALSLLATKSITQFQSQMIQLPTRHAGLGLVGPLNTMHSAYVGSVGSVARFYESTSWYDRHKLKRLLTQSPVTIAAAAYVNDELRKSRKGAKRLLNLTAPATWPLQNALSSIIHQHQANELEERMTKTDPLLASWFASGRQHGGSGCLAAIPSLPCFRVSSQVFQTMLCIKVLAPVPGTDMLQRCICGYSYKPLLENGVHFFSSCNLCSQVSIRHNHLLPIIQRALREIDRSVTEGESANWLSGNRSLRPYDKVTVEPSNDSTGLSQLIGYDVGVADPTRLGRLSRGTPYYQSGDASRRMQHRKNSNYQANLQRFGPLTKSVKFVPLIFEVTGSMGPNARDHFEKWCKEAAELVAKQGGRNYRALAQPHTWNAMKFSNLYSQMLSFSIVRDTAMTVIKAVEKAAAAASTNV